MLIKCKECSLQVSDKAEFCPHCGFVQPGGRKRKQRRKRSGERKRLPNGFGQISLIKDKNLRNPYRAMVSIGKSESGRSICRLLKPQAYFPTYNEAYAALVEYNRNPYDLEPGKTVRELFEEWSVIHYKKLKNYSSIRAVETAWSYCSSVYEMRLTDLRARHIKNCLENGKIIVGGNEKVPSAAMKNKIKSLFNLMLDYAYEYEMVEKNYARTFKLNEDTIKEILTVKKEHIAFSDEEIDLLWKHVDDKYNVDIVLIQCYSGWRPQELGLIEIQNVNLDEWTYTGGMKTDAGINRIVPIHSRIRPLVVKKYNEAVNLGSRYLLNYTDPERHDKSMKLTYDRYSRIFERIKSEIGLNANHRPHDGRKYFVTKAKQYNMDEYAIKYIVGHKILDITEKIYTERQTSWLAEEIEKIV